MDRLNELEKQNIDLINEINNQNIRIERQNDFIYLNSTKVEIYNRFLSIINLYSVSHVSNEVGVGIVHFLDVLKRLKIFSNSNLPFQRFIDKGYFKLKLIKMGSDYCFSPYITESGKDYIYSKLFGKHGPTRFIHTNNLI